MSWRNMTLKNGVFLQHYRAQPDFKGNLQILKDIRNY